MPLSPSYNPVTSFANDETNTVAGRSTVRTVALDTELANAASAINGLKTNIEKIQRDDGKLKDFIVEPYALSDQTRALITSKGKPRGLWVINTLYAVGDVVQQAGIAYICFTAHTSASPFTVNGFWIAISGDGSSAASAAAAAASQTASAASQTASAASAASASTAQTNASTSQTAAANSATAAGNSATASAGSATAAATSAGSASGFNDAAYTAAINAQTSAASINLPTPLTGKQLNFLRVKTDETGYEHRTALQARGDVGAAAAGANSDITSTGNNTSTVYAAAGTATAYTIVPNPAITAYTAGQAFKVSFGLASGAAPTLQINGIATPPNLVTQQANGTYANVVGIPAGHTSEVRLLSATQALVVTMPPAVIAVSVLTRSYTSGNQTWTAGGTLTLAHGMTIAPKIVTYKLVNLTAENGYSVGDVVIINPMWSRADATPVGFTPRIDATNIVIAFNGTPTHALMPKTGGAIVNTTPANWALQIEAFA